MPGIAIVGVCVGALAGCATTASRPLNPPLASPPTSPPPGAATEALAAYTGMWRDEQTAAVTADYNSPLLAQHATGAALSILVRGLYSYRLQHLVIKGTPVTHPHLTSLTPTSAPTQATVMDCFDDTHWLNYTTSGSLQNDVPGGHRRVTATVADLTGVWKVSELNTGAEGTC